MSRPYLCPLCRRNRAEFFLVYKLLQEIRKDASTGQTTYRSDEYEAPMRADGRPDVDVKCGLCGYVAAETAFLSAAMREDRAAR